MAHPSRTHLHVAQLPVARLLVAIVLGVALGSTAGGTVPQQKKDQKKDLAGEATRLIGVLQLRAGDSVADIGAGSGEMTLEIAGQLGATSKVYSTDINATRLTEIRTAVDAAKLSNVTILEGHADRTNLPDGCCEAIFVRHVYHHFGDPPAMNASIRRALKPGGRFAVMDFPPDKPGTETIPPRLRGQGETHGVVLETVVQELEAAGFSIVQTARDWPGRLFLVVAVSPGAPPAGK